MFKKQIEFEVKNGAFEPDYINSRVIGICGILCHQVKDYSTILDSVKEKVNNDLAALDLSHYYMPDGAKVTKPLKKILLTFLTKKELEPIWAEICKQISALYSPAFQAIAYFGDKQLIGTGEWEGRETCFNKNGINAQNGVFIQKFKRTQVLVVEETGTGHKARCLVYFQGGRNINLFNFYYNGFRQNNLIFVEAIRRLLSIPKITYKKESVNLPIYRNGDGLVIHTPKSFEYTADRIFPCPHCDTKLPEKKMLTAEEGNTHKIGCCEECLNAGGETCCDCGGRVDEDNSRTSDNGDTYCEDCYFNNFAYCEHCGNDVPNDDYLGDGYCNECGDQCYNCGSVHKKDNMYTGPDDECYCEECYNDKFSYCEGCEMDVERDSMVKGPDNEYYCPDCHADKFTECKDCGDVAEIVDIQDGLCPDCYDKKQEEEKEEEATLQTEAATTREGVSI